MSGRVTTRSRATSQSHTVSPDPVTASACRSMSLNRPCVSAPPAKACCMTVKPISRMIRIRPPPSAGCTISLSSKPVMVIHEPISHTSTITQLGTSMIARS